MKLLWRIMILLSFLVLALGIGLSRGEFLKTRYQDISVRAALESQRITDVSCEECVLLYASAGQVGDGVQHALEQGFQVCCGKIRAQVFEQKSICAHLREAFFALLHRGRLNIGDVVEAEIFVPEQSRLHSKIVQ